ncbi:E3 ubiquitin-protein ligase Topors-like [Metopolophium dirhodum]|uniref:E3 ubiquitin-protein ligase Topors-like n=1 Tax=Metopolophium dirhodum TaxID=44670 RepID=UPI00298F81B6|nr:E3 ubiquitin-protein ligase Topors-like [Metopolophium dirhodum]
MDILNNEPTGRPSTPDPRCSICLNELTNKCYTNACVHLFCFHCLKLWSNTCLQQCSSSEPTCPLCKKNFRYIYHSFNDLGTHETHTVPVLDRLPNPTPRLFVRPFNQLLNDNSDMHPLLNIDHVNQINMFSLPSVYNLGTLVQNHGQFFYYPSQNYPRPSVQTTINGQGARIHVYVDDVWAMPLPDTAGHFRYFTSANYRDDPTEMFRMFEFIIRDVVAIRESVRVEDLPMAFPENIDMIVTSWIMQSLASYEISHSDFFNNLRPLLNTRTLHFCHELYNFANSPYNIVDYDRNVQYYATYQPRDSESTAPFYQEQAPPIQTIDIIIVQDSDNEELQRPIIIEDSSSTDDSDVEILSQSSRSTDPLISASMDQPSTSTRLNIPNNSSRSEYGGLSRVSYSSQVKRGSLNLDSSSDDE